MSDFEWFHRCQTLSAIVYRWFTLPAFSALQASEFGEVTLVKLTSFTEWSSSCFVTKSLQLKVCIWKFLYNFLTHTHRSATVIRQKFRENAKENAKENVIENAKYRLKGRRKSDKKLVSIYVKRFWYWKVFLYKAFMRSFHAKFLINLSMFFRICESSATVWLERSRRREKKFECVAVNQLCTGEFTTQTSECTSECTIWMYCQMHIWMHIRMHQRPNTSRVALMTFKLCWQSGVGFSARIDSRSNTLIDFPFRFFYLESFVFHLRCFGVHLSDREFICSALICLRIDSSDCDREICKRKVRILVDYPPVYSAPTTSSLLQWTTTRVWTISARRLTSFSTSSPSRPIWTRFASRCATSPNLIRTSRSFWWLWVLLDDAITWRQLPNTSTKNSVTSEV